MIEYTNLDGQRCYVATSYVVEIRPSEVNPGEVWIILSASQGGRGLIATDPIEVLVEQYKEQCQAQDIAFRVQPLIDASVGDLAKAVTNAMGRAAGRIGTR